MTAHHEDIRRRALARVTSVLRGKYRLDRLLGLGGMACVYSATHQNNKNRVAIKLLHTELSVNADIRARFLREGYVANTVEHPGVVRVIDDDVTDDGAVFLVMDLLEGETVGARCERLGGKLPAADVVAIALQLLDVLAAAHAKEIVHRDIKPENIFVTRTSVVKMLDFGIARLREGTAAHSTQSGQMVGTPAFMAPEQALGRGEEIGPHTDVWAVGATMFTLLTGELPHAGRTNNELLVLAATTPLRLIETVAPDVDRSLAQVVNRAAAFDRNARFADAAAMRRALEDATRTTFPDGPKLAPAPASAHVPTEESIEPSIAEGFASTKLSPAPGRGGTLPSREPANEASFDAPRAKVHSTDALAPTMASGSQPPVGSTTTAGTASERNPGATPSTPLRRTRVPMVIAAAIVVAGATAAIAFALRGDAPAVPVAASQSASVSTSAAPSSQASAAPPATTTPPAPSASSTSSASPASPSIARPSVVATTRAPSPPASTKPVLPKANPLDRQ